MRLSGTKTGAINQYRGLGNQLWDLAGNRPSLDLPFADNKSLVDATTGANLVDFTRASSGTYVDSEGVIRTATTNLLLRSEDLTVSPWAKSAPVTVTADNSQGQPFSGPQVFRIVFSTSNETISQPITGINGVDYTGSIYIKGTAGESIRFAGSNLAGASNVTLTGQWQRIVFTGVSSSTSLSLVLSTFAGVTARTIYLTAAQLEQSTTVGEYIPTTSTINSAPRFDHDPTTGESLGLLVEEQRTNLLLRSEEFDITWMPTRASVTANSIVAPDGALTADKLVEDTTTGLHDVRQQNAYTSGVTYTWSLFLKATGEDRNLQVIVSTSAFPGNPQITVNSATGQIISSTDINARVHVFPNGWYRASFSATADATGSDSIFVRLLNGTTASYEGDGTSGIYIWGAQLEAGSFPTSYIPTTTAAATRTADVASISGSNFSSWYRQDEGTVFAEAERPDASRPNTVVASITDGSGLNRTEVRSSSVSNTNARCEITALGLGQYSNATLASDTAYKKIALAYAADNVNSAANGNAGITDTVATIPVVSQLYIGNDIFLTDYRPGHVKRLTYWPTRLPNETLQTITQ